MIRLLEFTPDHFPVLCGWFESETELVQWGGPLLSFPLTGDQLRAMLAEGETSPPGRLCWMAEQDQSWIGHAQLGFDWRNGNALLARVAVAPHARGRGLAAPMLSLLLDQAFARPEIERVELNVYAWNTPAIRCYERLGFRAEGVRRSATRVAGERWDTTIMGLLRPEWQLSTGRGLS